ncbi:MAG TPA: TadG family pilus assembly protein [Sphingomonas sp.]
MTHPLARFAGDRRGGVTIFTAICLTMLLASAALAVDMGLVYLDDRRLQGVADVAALAAAAATAPRQSTAAQRTIDANSDDGATLAATTPGAYTPDASLPPAQRFVAGGTPANATQVTVTQDVPLFFGRFVTGRPTTHIAVKATAARIDMAAFSIGSRLAAVQGGLPNALLSALAGTNLNLSVMDYNALAGANVDVLAFTDALRTQLHLTAASFGDTLNADATLPQILSALATATGDATAAAALRSIALKVPATKIALSNLIDLGPYAGQDHADPDSAINIDGYSILNEMLQLANGQRQLALNLGLSLPGITSTTLYLAIGQRPAHSPWLAVDDDGATVVRTAQARLYLDTQVAGAATLGLVSLRVPVYIELAQAQARLADIACGTGPSNATVTLSVQPAVGEIAIADLDTGTLDNFAAPVALNRALIAHALLVNVTGRADLHLGGVTWQNVPFSSVDIASGTIHTVSTGDIAQGVATSLISGIDLRVEALGLGVNLSALTATVGAVLTPLAPTLDGVVDQVTGLLGVHVGQADTRVDGVRCGKPILVG